MTSLSQGAGFIGSNLIAGLNRVGFRDILVVDHMGKTEKYKNLRGLKFSDLIDRAAFRELVRHGAFEGKRIRALFHQGACSDTLNVDGDYMVDNNYRYSRELLDYAASKGFQFIYASSASVYGSGKRGFKEDPECEFPLNLYAFSKLLFDNHVRRVSLAGPRWLGSGISTFSVPRRCTRAAWHLLFSMPSICAAKGSVSFEGSGGFARENSEGFPPRRGCRQGQPLLP